MIEKLKKRLDFELLDCKFAKRDNLDFLDIEINYSTLKEIQEKSKIISDILDEIDESSKEYYLNIYSPGVERNIDFKDINNFINEYIKIALVNPQLDSHSFEGVLLEADGDSIILKINMKGCFRKIKFQLSNITKIQKAVKVTKTKKGNQAKWKTKQTH